MSGLVWGMLTFQLVLVVSLYIWIVRQKKSIRFHVGMNVAMVVGGCIALGTGILLIYEFPIYYMEVTGISALAGILTGGLFGRLFSKEAMLSGYVSGVMTGMMAPMVGAAALYSIPFVIMIEVFIVCSFLMVFKEVFSIKVKEGSNE